MKTAITLWIICLSLLIASIAQAYEAKSIDAKANTPIEMEYR